MGRAQKNHPRPSHSNGVSDAPAAMKPTRARTYIQLGMAVVIAVLFVMMAWPENRSTDHMRPGQNATKPTSTAPASATPVQTAFKVEPKTLDELLALPVDQLGQVDIARINLLCAVGLPGAEPVDPDGLEHALATLDQWAKRVAKETDRHLYRVTDPRFAEHYRRSEAYYRAEMLLQVLQEDLGIKYDMTAADNFAFNDSRVAFIHGMIPTPDQSVADTSGGTCASMPVLYTAIGRRLGYPLKLVTTNSHIFVRWDGQEHAKSAWHQRFNIEATCTGFLSYRDEYYKTWPVPITESQVQANGYLLSLAPKEVFALFLAARGHCAIDNRQPAFAARCYENAHRYDSVRPCYQGWFLDAAMRCNYRPGTPALAMILDRKKQLYVSRMRQHPTGQSRPGMPSDVTHPFDVTYPRRIGAWRPQPMKTNKSHLPSPVTPVYDGTGPINQSMGNQP